MMSALKPKWIVLRNNQDTRVVSIYGYGSAEQGWYGYDPEQLGIHARCSKCGQCVFDANGNWDHWLSGKACDGGPLLINAPAWPANDWTEEKHG